MSFPRLPPHQESNIGWYEKGDSGGYFPSVASALEYKRLVDAQDYHNIRRVCLTALIDQVRRIGSCEVLDGRSCIVIDFGIGDGGGLASLGLNMRRIIGVDTSDHMIELARKQFEDSSFEGLVGGTEVLSKLSGPADVIVCLNTLGYLSAEDERKFWECSSNLLSPGGLLLIMTGNELFDLFALNSGTSAFFDCEFDVSRADRLLTMGVAERFVNARRKNPLNFPVELKKHGFATIATNYCMWHTIPPELWRLENGGSLRDARWSVRDFSIHALGLPESEAWRCLFQCSFFALGAHREG